MQIKTLEKFFAKKSFGQNFLIDKRTVQKILDSCEFKTTDIVLEIGPGKGALTRGIFQKVKNVIAIEKDNTLAENLKNDFKGTNVTIINDDILKFDFDTLPQNIKVVGNLPYNIATPIIEKILLNRDKINSFYITVQFEYGKRLVANAGTKDYSPLSCFIQYYANPKILFTIKNTCFSPVPKVQSCFLKITFPPTDIPQTKDEKFLFHVIHKTFQQRRKNLLNALSFIAGKKELGSLLTNLKINPQLRPENLTLNDYIRISNAAGERKEDF